MTRFLRWALVNVIFVLSDAVAAIAYHGHVHPAGKVAVAAVLVVYAFGSWQSARLALLPAWTARLQPHMWAGARAGLALAIRACPMLAMLGTVSGFLIAFSGDAGDVQQRVLGAATGLTATFVGISAALTLMVLRHIADPDA